MKFTHTAIVAFPEWIIKLFQLNTSVSKIEIDIMGRIWWIKREDIVMQDRRICIWPYSSANAYQNECDVYHNDWLKDIQEITPEQAICRFNVAMDTLKQIARQKDAPHYNNAPRLAKSAISFIENCL